MKHRGAFGYVLLGSLFVFAASCSGKDTPPVYAGGGSGGTVDNSGGTGGRSNNSGGKAGKGGSSGSGDANIAGAAGEASISPLAPQLTITSPDEATDPNTDAVIIDTQVTVLCTAKSSSADGASPLNPSTIQITLLDAKGATVKTMTGTATANANEYSAAFPLAAVASGPISFECTADDTASPVHHGSTTLKTLLDGGPAITANAPKANSAQSLLAPLDVEFTVAAVPLTASDTQADINKVTLLVDNKEIPTTAKANGLYQASVNFNDGTQFPSPPTGSVPIIITATNKRSKPNNATGTLAYNFILDGTGPVITVTAPDAGKVIGRASILLFTVTDAGSGVDINTVAVKLNDTTYPYSATDPNWSVDASGTSFTFKMGNTLLNDSTDSQVTVNVLASDKAANASQGEARLFSLDTQPPAVDLDPPLAYEATLSGLTLQCSDLFDPVGSAAPNDLSTITNFGYFRAVVWDQTNSKAGQNVFVFALPDHKATQIFVQPDVTKPLLADDNHDGICDEIWTGVAPHQKNPTDTALQFVGLDPLTPAGAPSFTGAGGAGNEPTDPACHLGGNLQPAAKLCSGKSIDMTVAVHHPVAQQPPEPAIYAVEPKAGDTSQPTCTGTQWDIGSATSPAGGSPKLGWVCVAARAVDTVGNPGISAPLRLCLDDGSNPHRCDGITPPTCTDNCTPPPHFQLPTTGIFN